MATFLDIFGKFTSAGNVYDSLKNLGSSDISKLNTAAQVAAASAGAFAGISPGTAISAGLAAADIQITKLFFDAKNSASFSTYAGDVIGILGDAAIVGGGITAYLGNQPVGQFFAGLGAITDIAGVGFNHPDWVIDKTQQVIDAISASGSSTLDSLGSMLENLKNDLSNYTNQSNYQNANQLQDSQNILRSADQGFSDVANAAGISSISTYIPDSGTAEKTTWGDNNGNTTK